MPNCLHNTGTTSHRQRWSLAESEWVVCHLQNRGLGRQRMDLARTN